MIKKVTSKDTLDDDDIAEKRLIRGKNDGTIKADVPYRLDLEYLRYRLLRCCCKDRTKSFD